MSIMTPNMSALFWIMSSVSTMNKMTTSPPVNKPQMTSAKKSTRGMGNRTYDGNCVDRIYAMRSDSDLLIMV